MSALARLNLALATGLFVSYLPYAITRRQIWSGAGLLGTAWGLVLLPLTPQDPHAFLAFTAVATLVAVPIAGMAGRTLGEKDDARIIIDEIVGFWAAVLYLPRDAWHLAAAFLLFRLFDATKPGPVGRMERLPGGWGVVLDDTLAGLLACGVVHLWDALAPLVPHAF